MNTRCTSMLLLLTGMVLSFAFAASQHAGKRLWVLHGSGEIIEYDPFSWAALNSVRVPAQFVLDPESLQINAEGRMLFCADPQIEFGNQDQHFPRDKVWLWDGQSALVFDRGPAAKPGAGKNPVVESRRWWALSKGPELYIFEDEFTIVRNPDGAEESVSTEFQVWAADLKGVPQSRIAVSSFPACRCDTGACSETCPEAGTWFPAAGVDDFFVVTHWIPGQIDVTYQASFVYRKTGLKWAARRLPRPLEDVLDSTESGAMIVHRILDGGCCGWENTGNDQTVLEEGGRRAVLFDERRRYGNPDYDISFFSANARISPGRRYVAMTIDSTVVPGKEKEIRPSVDGKSNPAELVRIRRAIAELPAVEVLPIDGTTDKSVRLPKSALAGWLSEREILIIENGALAAFDVKSGNRRRSSIGVVNPSFVFLR